MQSRIALLSWLRHPRNLEQSIRWFRAAADAGAPEAQSNLAYFYFNGLAIQRDYTEAARLLKLAAQQGLPAAQTNLAYLYEQGKGVPLDYIAAYTWYSRAISAGDRSGLDNRAALKRLMTAKQRDEATTLATTSSPQPTQPSTNTLSLLPH